MANVSNAVRQVMGDQGLVSVPEAAEIAGRTPATIRRLLREGRLLAYYRRDMPAVAWVQVGEIEALCRIDPDPNQGSEEADAESSDSALDTSDGIA